MIFLPVSPEAGIQVSRIDYMDKTEINFDIASSLGKSVSKNIGRMERIINDEFSSKKIGNGFAKENGNPDLTKLLGYSDRIVIFNENFEGDSMSVNGKYYPSFRNINDLKKYVSNDLWRRYEARKNYNSYALLYNIDLNIEEKKAESKVPDKIEGYEKTLEIEHANAKNWQELYSKAEQFILTNEEHEYNHPSAYCYVICAAEKAIATGKSEEMYSQMRLDCPNNSLSKNICRLKEKAHEHIWNKVLAGVKTKDREALEAIEEKLMSEWVAHLKGEQAETIIEKFESEIEHADAKNWQELYYASADYLLSEEEHAYDHPSAYCYLVCAAEKAIETGSANEMKKSMENVCSDSNPKSKNLCKLKSGHEKNWNAVIASLAKSDSRSLEELEEGIMSRWLAHLKSN